MTEYAKLFKPSDVQVTHTTYDWNWEQVIEYMNAWRSAGEDPERSLRAALYTFYPSLSRRVFWKVVNPIIEFFERPFFNRRKPEGV